ncbi:YhfT family protein [Streptomyces sp. NPDC050610]|uniref:YhfT family protein n=1 Tax=Streptomyces sp. NPDC050610 TaxID=3157097 RepID=UPI00343D3116
MQDQGPGAVALAASGHHSLSLSPTQIVLTVVVCALSALLVNMAVAVFHDGVRPFMLDYRQGRMKRREIATIAFSLSSGFIFGLGAPMAFSTGVLNPWLLFLPTDILGLLAPRRWLAPVLGAAWALLVIFGLAGATDAAQALPVDFLTAMQALSDPVMYLFAFFPAVAIAYQFGKARGGIAFAVEGLIMLATAYFWKSLFPGALAMAAGMAMLVAFAVRRDVVNRRTARAEAAARGEELPVVDTSAADSLFGGNAKRLRKYLPWLLLLGGLTGALCATGVFAGGEATSYIVQKGDMGNAAQIDFYRTFGFIPLIGLTSLASGVYATNGMNFVYAAGYIAAPNLLVGGIAGVAVFGVEVLALSQLGRLFARVPSMQDASDHIRNAINQVLEIAVLFGSILAGMHMGGGVGVALVGGLYVLNEAMGRPVMRLAAAPCAVILVGIALNLASWAHLFTPIKIAG